MQKNRQQRQRLKGFVPVITSEGLKANLSLDSIRRSGKITTCHGKTFDGRQVDSAAFHTSGNSIVLSPDNQFAVGVSMPQADFEVLATRYLEGIGATVTPPKRV